LNTNRMKIELVFLISLTIIITIALVIIASSLNARYYLLLIVTLPLIYLSLKQHQRLNRAKLIANLRKKWGVAESGSRNFPELHAHYKKTLTGDDNKYVLDDRTWNDLDMDLIYAQIDRTMTIPGELSLFSLLRRPLVNEEELKKRNYLINLFSQDQSIREEYQVALSKLGKREDVYNLDILWEEKPPVNRYTLLYSFILLLIPIFLLFAILNYNLAWFGLGAAILCNMFIHYRTKQKIYEHLSSFRYLGKLIRCAKSLTEIRHPILENYREEIEQSLAKVSSISKKTSLLGREEDSFYISEYFNIIFLIEVRAFYSVINALEKYEKQLRQIFTTVGFMDALIAVASYRAGLESYAEPKFLNSETILKIKEGVHPLLNEPVPNSISVGSGGILITGSNMSGKTTFLKVIGVNAVLAQTIYTCSAKEYQASFFHIMTLIGRKDNVIEGKSYYLDEIYALLRIINALETDIPCLCLLDEIFRGTNSLERISSSAEVLLYLAKNNCCVFAATHDLELAELLVNSYKNYHFKEEVSEEDGISFNYRLLDGISTTRNAITLLRHAGYPEEIAGGADLRVQKSDKNKKL
jgi:DNA mismatch repair ATPase MutS